MGQAIPLSIRERIVKLRQNGKKFTTISQEEQIPYSTVRKIWKRFERKGLKGLAADYQNCGLKGCQTSKIKRVALWLRYLHPDWGAPFIHMILEERYGLDGLPSIRSIQLWFRAAGRNKVRAVRPVIEKKSAKGS
jgi:transposase